MDIQTEIAGENTILSAKLMNNMASLYLDMNDFEKASYYHKKALEIRIKIVGERHPEVASSYYSIASVLKKWRNMRMQCIL